MKSVAVMLLQQQYYLHPYSETTEGVLIKADPEVIIHDLNDKHCISKTLLKMFDCSVKGVKHPTDWSKFNKPFWKLGGNKSWSVFNKSAKYVGVNLKNEVIQLIPTKNAGARGGFEPINDKAIEVSLTEIGTIADILIEAFDLCE